MAYESCGVVFNEIFKAARVGDLDKIRSLCEEQDVDFNVRDEWDSTPLYYACLCGHADLVEFMLQNGARCKANTFDGERCLYAALTQRIKKALRDFKAITSECMRREYFKEFLRSAFQQPCFQDVTFDVHGEMIAAHKVILAARCPYMAEMLQTKWKNRQIISIRHKLVDVTAFRYFIHYLYTGRVDMSLDHMNGFIAICKQCRMMELINDVESLVRNFHSYADSKFGYMKDRVSILTVGDGGDQSELYSSFSKIAESCIPDTFNSERFSSSLPDIFNIGIVDDEDESDFLDYRGIPLYADICFVVEGYRFYCHQLFVCGRSDYFKALRSFSSSNEEMPGEVPEITLNDISAECFATVIYYIYTDKCQISKDVLLEALSFSDLFLLPGLKQLCSASLAQQLSSNDVIKILKLARLYNIDRLDAQCCEFIAERLQEIINQPEFSELVLEDAHAIQGRQETDSIQIIDDVRYHIMKYVLPGVVTNSDGEQYSETKLSLLDQLLVTLGLDA